MAHGASNVNIEIHFVLEDSPGFRANLKLCHLPPETLVYNSRISNRIPGTSKNSDFVIPAKAGIQYFKWAGHRPSPV
ncbi:MAG: hypothetical protein NUV63_00600 [Gallionella sp.]|nr:hypothetical protein [Gallionella sp.]